MANQISFFLTNTRNLYWIDTIEMDHPDFVEPFYFQNEYIDEDIVATNEDLQQATYSYQLFDVKRNNVVADLDQGVGVTFADYKDVLKTAVNAASSSSPITLRYRVFRSDDLTSPMDFIQVLKVVSVNCDAEGFVTFQAGAEQLNNVKTGDTYTLNKYPLLKGTI